MILHGTAVSRGVAIGKVLVYRPFAVETAESHFPPEELAEHQARHKLAMKNAEAELTRIREKFETSDPDKAAIIKAHLEILNDEVMAEEVAECIEKEYCAPDWAIEKVFADAVALFDDVDDPLIKERAADLRDVRIRLLRNWHGLPECNLAELAEPVIVVAHDLLPSDTATLDRSKVMAIVTEIGGPTSHTAIIAKSYGIPAVVGVGGLMDAVRDGQEAAVDALDGVVILDPTGADRIRFTGLAEQFRRGAEASARYLAAEPLTADGVRVDIGLNIGGVADAGLASLEHVDFIGLFRTEFLYMERQGLPSEEEQYQAYRAVLERAGGRPVTIRTLDVGGDKTLPAIDLPHEDNPFLGNRALRLCFSRPEIFTTQLRALVRAAAHGSLWLMLPMVTSLDDIRRAKDFIDAARRDLPAVADFKVGIMVEVPAIAAVADLAAAEVDFASIGTNDLCQYLTAADRLNPAVSGYYQSYHPALFRTVRAVAGAFAAAGKPVSICGEMAGDPAAAAALVGLGLRKLSMGPGAVAEVKHMLSRFSLAELEAAAERACALATAADVENHLADMMK